MQAISFHWSGAVGRAALKALPHCMMVGMFSMGLLGLTQEVSASPVTYELGIGPEGPGSGPSGALGSFTFGSGGSVSNVEVRLIFQGDTANVMPWTTGGASPANGYEILTGLASVEIVQGGSTILAQGTFDPSAGIFVSIDNTNLGIGFGSHAVGLSKILCDRAILPAGGMLWRSRKNWSTSC